MDIRPFAAIHPRPDLMAQVAALPYDVVTPQEARDAVAAHPKSFLAIDLPAETGFPADKDPYAPEVYQRAQELFSAAMESGDYVQDAEPHYYIYQLEDGERSQRGLVCVVGVADYLEDRVKRHENTRVVKENDRIAHIEAVGAQTGPVFLAYDDEREDGSLEELLDAASAGEPWADFVDDEGVRNRLWRVDDPWMLGQLSTAAGALECAYIADGHHRGASAVKVAQRHAGDPDAADDADAFIAVLFPASELSILAYNRVVADRAGLTPAQLLAAVEDAGYTLEPRAEAASPSRQGNFTIYTDGHWYELFPTPELVARRGALGAADSLDVARLQAEILAPILSIGDPREDPRIEFVGGIRGLGALEDAAAEKGVAIACWPTSVEQLMAVADAGELMPPKSTWFEPKLRSGLVFHKI